MNNRVLCCDNVLKPGKPGHIKNKVDKYPGMTVFFDQCFHGYFPFNQYGRVEGSINKVYGL